MGDDVYFWSLLLFGRRKAVGPFSLSLKIDPAAAARRCSLSFLLPLGKATWETKTKKKKQPRRKTAGGSDEYCGSSSR